MYSHLKSGMQYHPKQHLSYCLIVVRVYAIYLFSKIFLRMEHVKRFDILQLMDGTKNNNLLFQLDMEYCSIFVIAIVFQATKVCTNINVGFYP